MNFGTRDEYLIESSHFSQLINQLRTEIFKKKSNPNENSENFDKQIRKLIEEVQGVISNLKEMNDEAKLKKNLSHFEMEKRMNEFEERKKNFNNLKNEYSYTTQGKKLYDNTSAYNLENPQEHYLKLQEERKNIDQEVLEMTNTVKQIKKAHTHLIGDVLQSHNKLAEATDKTMDKSKVKLSLAQQRLNQYLETSSNPCLGFVIFVEIAILVLVILTV